MGAPKELQSRSLSSEASSQPKKRRKSSHKKDSENQDTSSSAHPVFVDGILDKDAVDRLHKVYTDSAQKPWKHVALDTLVRDDLLRKVRDECIDQLAFTEKETDIYKVNQTGDLASLSFLSSDQLALLPSLLRLRDALYSPDFLSFLRGVTGCGPLSSTKRDMSVNSYTKNCHLLNHDDVIGTRRVSWILYMPISGIDTSDDDGTITRVCGWQKEWGGALELYPVKTADGSLGGEGEPECVPEKIIPPSWGQYVFFEVQPGRSFHSVEEVVVGDMSQGDARARLSISGWFHAAQEGEDGHMADEGEKFKSSLEQLSSTSSSTSLTPYPSPYLPPLPTKASLSAEDISFLSKYLNPFYLQPKTIKALAERFTEESSIEAHSFLSDTIAQRLRTGLKNLDAAHGLSSAGREGTTIPPHDAGVRDDDASPSSQKWTIKGPPHKWRYCTLTTADPTDSSATPGMITAPELDPDPESAAEDTLRELQDDLFVSKAFRTWLTCVASLVPLSYAIEARRFRPGLDYTLATSCEDEFRLDAVLGLTPEVEDGKGGAKGKKEERGSGDEEDEAAEGWEAGEWGGWECYMAPHEGEDDPAVYRTSYANKQQQQKPDNSSKLEDKPDVDGDVDMNGEDEIEAEPEANAEVGERDADDDEEEEDDDDEGTLLTSQPGFNRLLLVLRDPKVMRFVKYVSAAAPGSRWDVCGEFQVDK